MAGLSGVDRVLGMVLAWCAGAAADSAHTLLVGLTDLPQHTLWQHSAAVGAAAGALGADRARLAAPNIAARVHFAQADDAAPLSGWVSPQVSDMGAAGHAGQPAYHGQSGASLMAG